MSPKGRGALGRGRAGGSDEKERDDRWEVGYGGRGRGGYQRTGFGDDEDVDRNPHGRSYQKRESAGGRSRSSFREEG